MNIPCRNYSACPDVYPPYVNLSSEDPDRYVCIGRSWGNYQSPPRLGSAWTERDCYQTCELSLSDIDLIQCRALGADMCSGECVQSVSQTLADQCAANLSQCGDQCDTTGRACFSNTRQECTVTCPDGTEFTYVVQAGTYQASSVAIANEQAYSFACQQANALKHCATTDNTRICVIYTDNTLPYGVLGIHYSEQIMGAATGTPNRYSIIFGSLPPGLTMNTTGLISGTPTTGGDYTFTVRLAGGSVTSCVKVFTLSITPIATPSAYWKMEEASGARFDALGVSENNLIFSGGVDGGRLPGIIGNGMYFNNAPFTSFVTTAGSTLKYDTASDGFTVAFWIKFTGAIAGNRFRAFLNAWDIVFLVDVLTSDVTFQTQPASGPYSVATVPVDLTHSNWCFVVGQYRSSTMKSRVCVNAGPWTEATDAANLAGATTTPCQWAITPILSITGILDEMGIWVGTVLTDAQITSLYNSGHGRTYPF